jgi:hypothetical protein
VALRWRLTDLSSLNSQRLRSWLWRRLVDLREIVGGTNDAWAGLRTFAIATAFGALTVGWFIPAEWGWRFLLASVVWTALWRSMGRGAALEQRAYGLAPAHPAGWWLVGAGGLGAVAVVGLLLHVVGLPGWAVMAGGVFASIYAIDLVSLVLTRVWPAANPMGWYVMALEASQRQRIRERREAIERSSPAAYVVNHGRAIHEDIDGLGELRRLWRAERPGGDSALVMVEVRNSTLEPDGSRRTYWLRVPPHINTCQAAVAWTFGIERPDDYRLASES